MARLVKTTPVYRMFDEQKARDHYLGHLGFEIVFEHRFSDDAPPYMGIQRDGVNLHFSEHHGDCTPGSSIRIEVEDIDALHRELQGKNYKYYNPGIQEQPWGSREMSVQDPFGNRVIYFETVDH